MHLWLFIIYRDASSVSYLEKICILLHAFKMFNNTIYNNLKNGIKIQIIKVKKVKIKGQAKTDVKLIKHTYI